MLICVLRVKQQEEVSNMGFFFSYAAVFGNMILGVYAQ